MVVVMDGWTHLLAHWVDLGATELVQEPIL